ncbi:glucosidase II beta subunit-like-domain-containing protein [Chytriomyces sp. MP71]|nr:glucosidase II beta subunit-like-domain-containing protein [Chytriomyces sp. MP71]
MRLTSLLTTASLAAASLPRGVPDHLAVKYTPGMDSTFTCFDGSNVIAFSAVNDDFCDCHDGSDEPGTSACPTAQFHCKNDGHLPSSIASSRVNDGVCDIDDCCDGSDETLSGIVCENACARMAARANTVYIEAKRDFEEGIVAKREYMSRKAIEDVERQVKMDSLHTELAQLEKEVDAAKELLEEQEREIRAAYAPPPLPDSSSTNEPDEAITTETHVPESTGDVMVDEFQEIEAPDASTYGELPGDEIIQKEPVETTPEPPEVIAASNAAVDARSMYNDLSSTYNTKKTEFESLHARQNLDLGFDGGLGILADTCLEYDTPEYTYKLCFYEKAVQYNKQQGGETSLGSWNAWTGQDQTAFSGKNQKYFEAQFFNGLVCWNGPARSVKVSLECGARNDIISFTEPNKCEYAARVKTPGLCESDEDVEKRHREAKALAMEEPTTFDEEVVPAKSVENEDSSKPLNLQEIRHDDPVHGWKKVRGRGANFYRHNEL